MNKNDKQFMAEKIRTQYMEKNSTDLDELRALDAKVKRPANIFAYVFGSIGAIIMGAGMSLVMTDLGSIFGSTTLALVIGILVAIIGAVGVALAYPVYNVMTQKERRRIAHEILRLTEELTK
jgi:uncharacterized membrane protein YuzA (DUF378 family)